MFDQTLQKLRGIENDAAHVKKMLQAVQTGSVNDGIQADDETVTIGGVTIHTP